MIEKVKEKFGSLMSDKEVNKYILMEETGATDAEVLIEATTDFGECIPETYRKRFFQYGTSKEEVVRDYLNN